MARQVKEHLYSIVEISTGNIVCANETAEALADRYNILPHTFTDYAYAEKTFRGKYVVIINPDSYWIGRFKQEWIKVTRELLEKNEAGAKFYY